MPTGLTHREALVHALRSGDKTVDELEGMTGRPRKQISNILPRSYRHFVKRQGSYRNARWGLRGHK